MNKLAKYSGRGALMVDEPLAEMMRSPVNCALVGTNDWKDGCNTEIGIESIATSGFIVHGCSTSVVVNTTKTSPQKLDAAVQCNPDEMLEPMAQSNLFQQRSMAKIHNAARLWQTPQSSYSVASHFCFFEDPDILCMWSQELSPANLEALADRFFGSEIAGAALKRRNAVHWRQVGERYVKEATMLARARPMFQQALFRSAWHLLLGGLENLPRGHSLLDLAEDNPQDWSGPATTALDFTSRLVQNGVLPKAFIPEILKHQGVLNAQYDVVVRILLCCKSCGVSQQNREIASGNGIGQRRTMSSPATFYQCETKTILHADVQNRLRRTNSLQVHVRSIGTTLHPQADLVHSQVSFAAGGMSLGKKRVRLAEHTIIPIEIDVADLPDYWRHAAGGEHAAETLERFACEAEKPLM